MSNIYILVGPTASGKSTVLKNLENEVEKIITYTTRPKRDGEADGVDYYFCQEPWFRAQLADDFFLETTEYNTVHGLWHYGSAKESYVNSDKDKIVVLNYEGARRLYDLYHEQGGDKKYARPVLIFFYVSEDECKRRALKRGDDPFEVERRIREDKNIEWRTDIRMIANYTMDAYKDVNTLSNEIRNIMTHERRVDHGRDLYEGN